MNLIEVDDLLDISGPIEDDNIYGISNPFDTYGKESYVVHVEEVKNEMVKLAKYKGSMYEEFEDKNFIGRFVQSAKNFRHDLNKLEADKNVNLKIGKLLIRTRNANI